MKQINLIKRQEVVRLFFSGLTYDEIARRLGLSKGSVVTIISEFKDGDLATAKDMDEYIDAMRKLAVDLRISNTDVRQSSLCLKIHNKINEMGIDTKQAESWLEICREVAGSPANSNEFVSAALELAQLASDNGLSYTEIVKRYKTIHESLGKTEIELNGKNKELESANKRKKQAAGELDSINKATSNARMAFNKQKEELKSKQDRYLAEIKLSWEDINLVKAAVDSGLSSSRLTQDKIDELRSRIIAVGSLRKVMGQFEQNKNVLSAEIYELTEYEQQCQVRIRELEKLKDQHTSALIERIGQEEEVEEKIQIKRKELITIEQKVTNKIENLYVSRLIIDFLFYPNGIGSHDLDRLVNMMIALRQKRLGVGPKQVTDPNGKIVCQCQVPSISINMEAEEVDTDHAKDVFAHFLTPLVKDRMISKIDYELEKITHKALIEVAKVDGRIELLQEMNEGHRQFDQHFANMQTILDFVKRNN